MRAAWLLIAVVAVALVGCGGNTTAPPTTTVAEGATVEADRYLADAAAGAAAVRAFVAELAAVGAPATEPRLKAVAPRLEQPLATATLVSQRLNAERLVDQRLDEQRTRDAAGFAQTVSAMRSVHAATLAGDPEATKLAVAELDRSLGALRDQRAP